MKIDIEGSEPIAIRQLLAAARDQDDLVVIYESNQAVTGSDVRDLHSDLASGGFRLWYLDALSGDAVELDPALPQPAVNCDVLAIRGSASPPPTALVRTRQELLERLEAELVGHPITIHRSYAFAALEALVGSGSVPHEMPTHRGAQDELSRFRSVLAPHEAGLA